MALHNVPVTTADMYLFTCVWPSALRWCGPAAAEKASVVGSDKAKAPCN